MKLLKEFWREVYRLLYIGIVIEQDLRIMAGVVGVIITIPMSIYALFGGFNGL